MQHSQNLPQLLLVPAPMPRLAFSSRQAIEAAKRSGDRALEMLFKRASIGVSLNQLADQLNLLQIP